MIEASNNIAAQLSDNGQTIKAIAVHAHALGVSSEQFMCEFLIWAHQTTVLEKFAKEFARNGKG